MKKDKAEFFKVIITKEFIEESKDEFGAQLEAISDLQYSIDKELHTPLEIIEILNIEARPLTESEFVELERNERTMDEAGINRGTVAR